MTVSEYYGNWLELRNYRCKNRFTFDIRPEHWPECFILNFRCHLKCTHATNIFVARCDIQCRHLLWTHHSSATLKTQVNACECWETVCQPNRSWDICSLHLICIWIYENENIFHELVIFEFSFITFRLSII